MLENISTQQIGTNSVPIVKIEQIITLTLKGKKEVKVIRFRFLCAC